MSTITCHSAASKENLEIGYISKWNQVQNIINHSDIDQFYKNRELFSKKVFCEDDGNSETERYRFIHSLLVKQGKCRSFIQAISYRYLHIEILRILRDVAIFKKIIRT